MQLLLLVLHVSVLSKVIKQTKKFFELMLAEYSDWDRGSTYTVADSLNRSMLSHVKANLLTHLSTLTSSRPSLNKNVMWPPPAAAVITMVAGGLYASIQWTVSKCFGAFCQNKWIYLPFSPDIGDTDKQKIEGQFLTVKLTVKAVTIKIPCTTGLE